MTNNATSYTNIFTGNPIATSPTAYASYSFAVSTVLSWPITNEDTPNVAADIMEITTTAAGLFIAMPPANEVSCGQSCIIKNSGSNSFTITDANSGTIISIAAGQIWWVYVTNNSSIAGSWDTFQYGSTTTTANASALAGNGLVAIGTTLNLQFPLNAFNSNFTVATSYRANLLEWTSGAGTFSFNGSSTYGNGWFCLVKNSGTGSLTLAATDTIDGQSSIQLAPDQSCFVACSGAALYTVGLNQQATLSYTRLVISVAGGSNVTLTSAQAAYSIIEFTGTLTANIEVIVPAAVNIWWFYNNTTGAYTLTVQTSGGTGVLITQGLRTIAHCDGTNVVYSINTTSGTVSNIATGTGLSGGPITSTGTISLANTAVTAGSYGASNNLITLTVNAQGQLTAAANEGVGLLASNNLSDVSSASSALSNIFPSGIIVPYAGSAAPTGWLLCYGQQVSTTTYANLYAAIGTTYGSGTGTFGIPDLRGNVAVGLDNMGGTAANRITNAICGITGTTLGASGGNQSLQQHTHTIVDPGHIHTNASSVNSWRTGDAGNQAAGGSGVGVQLEAMQSALTGITAQYTGTGLSQNVQPSIMLNYIIKT